MDVAVEKEWRKILCQFLKKVTVFMGTYIKIKKINKGLDFYLEEEYKILKRLTCCFF